MSALQCYNSSKYTIATGATDWQCIAATAKSERCKLSCGKYNLADIMRLQNIISNTSEVKLHLQTAQDLVLARCCTRWHRHKLSGDPACLERVAKRYLEHFGNSKPMVKTEEVESTIAVSNDKPNKPVVPYSTRPSLNEFGDALRAYAGKLERTGFVYVFSSSIYPGLVKIGYSKYKGERPEAWAKCMPGMKLLTETPFAFPRRIERLIHLQLHSQRRKVSKCWRCEKTHLELFEMAEDDAMQVVREWHKMTTREALYSEDGMLRPIWTKRVAGMPQITAQKLFEVHKSEEMTKRSESIKSEPTTNVKQEAELEERKIISESQDYILEKSMLSRLILDDIKVKLEDDVKDLRSCNLQSDEARRLAALQRWSVALQQVSEVMGVLQKEMASTQRVADRVDERVWRGSAIAV